MEREVEQLLKIALCTCNGKIDKKCFEKLKEVFDVEIFSNLCEEKPENFFNIVGCSYRAVKDLGRLQLDLNELVFLKQEDAVRKAELLLNAYGKLLDVDRDLVEVNVDASLLVETNDVEFAKKLQKVFDPLYIVTTNEKMRGVGIPILGKVEGFEGELGNFKVFVNGINLHTGESVSEITVAQLLLQNLGFKKMVFLGFEDVLDAVSNVGEFVKFKAIEYDESKCAASFNGISGCNLCECMHKCLFRGEKIRIEHKSCFGCGRCSALCPTNALKFSLMPENVVREIIDVLSQYEGSKVLLYVCEDAVGKIFGNGRTETFFPVIVPCIAALSEVEILYPLLRGFNGVYVLHCSDCPHGDFRGLELAKNLCEAFNVDNLVSKTEFDVELVKKLVGKDSLDLSFVLGGKNKREALVEIVKKIKEKRELKHSKIEAVGFGKVKVNENCTLCDTCHRICPNEALKKEKGRLTFIHGLCINCKLCEKLCPENAIFVAPENIDLNEFEIEKVVREEEFLKCPRCGREHISKREYLKLSEITGQKFSLMFCDDCRPVVIFEGLYREIFGEKNEPS